MKIAARIEILLIGILNLPININKKSVTIMLDPKVRINLSTIGKEFFLKTANIKKYPGTKRTRVIEI
jgi:hypothetical protein